MKTQRSCLLFDVSGQIRKKPEAKIRNMSELNNNQWMLRDTL